MIQLEFRMRRLKTLLCLCVLLGGISPAAAQLTEKDLYAAVDMLEAGKVDEGVAALMAFPYPESLADSAAFLALVIRIEVNSELYNAPAVIPDCDYLFTILSSNSDRNYLDMLDMRARAKKYTGDLDGAASDLREIMEKDPEDEKVYSSLAGVLIHAKKPEEALKVLHADPGGMTLGHMPRSAAKAHLMLGQLDSAEYYITACMQLKGGSGSHIAWLYAAQIFDESGNAEEACTAITEAARIAEAKNIRKSYSEFSKKHQKLWVFKNGFSELDLIVKMKKKLCK
jgi:tetratricopeptide (TPR) repeat protein